MCQKIDNPTCCRECDFYTRDNAEYLMEVCDKTGRMIVDSSTVMDGCPLKSPPTRTIKEYIDRYDVGMCLHTSLRKMCEGPWTNVAYHTLKLFINMENDLWTEYCGRIWEEIKDRSFVNTNQNYKMFAVIVSEITISENLDTRNKCIGFFQNIHGMTFDKDWKGETLARLLQQAFENFTKDDWTGYVSMFCEDWHK